MEKGADTFCNLMKPTIPQVLYILTDQIYGFKNVVKFCLPSKVHISLLIEQLLTNPVQDKCL